MAWISDPAPADAYHKKPRLGGVSFFSANSRELAAHQGFPAWTQPRSDTALQNAASIAGLLITTEARVAELPKKEEPAPAGHGGGMGGMDF